MKKYLAPSILAADFAILGEQIHTVEKAGAKYLHIDMMDGVFVPSISLGMPVISSIRPVCNMLFDVHMMVIDPIRYVGEVRKAGADIISVHYEACDNLKETLLKIEECGAVPGVVINPDTDVEVLRPYLPYVKQVMLMSVYPGFGGQKFIEATYERIRKLVSIREEMKLDFLIETDGGVCFENIKKIADAGVDILVAGTAVFKNDIYDNVIKLTEEMNV